MSIYTDTSTIVWAYIIMAVIVLAVAGGVTALGVLALNFLAITAFSISLPLANPLVWIAGLVLGEIAIPVALVVYLLTLVGVV